MVKCLLMGILLNLVLLPSSFAANAEDELWEELLDDGTVGRVYMQGEFHNGDLLKISVEMEEMQIPVLGAAFHLLFEEEKLAFLKYEPGEFLERGGDPFYLVKADKDEGKIVFGETLRKDDNFPLGDGELVDFYFQKLKEGEFSFEFERGVVSNLDVVRQDLDRIAWDDFKIVRGNGMDEDPGDELADNIKLDSHNLSFEGKWLILILVMFALLLLLGLTIYIKKREKRLR